MIERIQELYTEAVKYANSIIPPERRYNDIYYATVCGKHGELILKECVATMMKTRETQCDGPDEKFGCDCAIMDVKEHFGVEE